ncbi:MAG TPA: BrnT family toxin [Polyangia bacterium]
MDLVERLRGCIGFEWDDGNAEKNWVKHQVSRGEAEEVFFNEPLVVADDEEHSAREERFFVLGHTNRRRALFLVCTIRGELIRVISARDMTKKEREVYRAHG